MFSWRYWLIKIASFANIQKSWKMGVFVRQNSPLKNNFSFFFSDIFLARPRGTFWTPELWSGTQNEDFQRWSLSDHKWSFLIISSQKSSFFTDQDMIKVIAQNCAKTKRPTKKIDKSNFKVHGPRSVFHLLTLIRVLRKRPQFCGQNWQNSRFLEFLKKRKMANFKSKNLCDESSKIKNLRWQFSCIFRCLCRGVLHFFCRRHFHGENCRSKSPFLDIFKKLKKMRFCTAKFDP